MVKVTRGHPAGPGAPTLAWCAIPHLGTSHSSCSSLLRCLAPARCSGRSWVLVQLWSGVLVPRVDFPPVPICLLPTQFLDFLSFSPDVRPQRVLGGTGGGEGPVGASRTPMLGPFSYSVQIYRCVILNFHSLSTVQAMV